MDRPRYDALVSTFFDPDAEGVAGIFADFLALLNADPPPPEVGPSPGGLADARDAVLPYFLGTDGRASPLHVGNVRGPASLASLVGGLACLLKNPNLCTHADGGRSSELEENAVAALSDLVFDRPADPCGVFTAGGTVSNLYGAKVGVEKAVPGAMRTGLSGVRVAGVCSEAAHHSAATVAGWLGIGTDNLHRVPTDRDMAMRPDALADKLDELYRRGDAVAFVLATFGSTDAFGVDDVAGIRAVIDGKAREHGRPAPHLHADAAVGWGLCFLRDYDTAANPLRINTDTLPVIERAKGLCRGLLAADSVTVDFHKAGRGHYPGSAFLVNRRDDLRVLARAAAAMPYLADAFDARDPAVFTLETSRPAFGPYTVMASLDAIGRDGWRMLTARGLELAQYLKARLAKLDYCQVLNAGTPGVGVVWWVLPKGCDAKRVYADLEAGRLSADDVQRYAAEVRRLFAARERTLDPSADARLGFTTDFGHRPHGHELPAWKCVFLHPRTDEAVIDRLVWSVERL